MTYSRLGAPEDGVPLLDERLRGLAVVLGQPAARGVPRFQIEQVFERPALRRVEVPLHVAVGDPRAPREPCGERQRFLLEARVRDDPVDHPELPRFAGVHDVRREVELARLPGADERSEEHTSELSHSQISYAVFCLKKKKSDKSAFSRMVRSRRCKSFMTTT